MTGARLWQPTPVFFPGEPQGRWSLVGCHLWGCTESDTTEATWQQQDLGVSCLRRKLHVLPQGEQIPFSRPKGMQVQIFEKQ